MMLPIHAARSAFEAALGEGSVVLTSPTGSGKSTEVPRWVAATTPVLVVEPRRVACRALASRVSELEGAPLGGRVGYAVRDAAQYGADTQILFATPGMVLHQRGLLARFGVVVLDEFHERGLDTDLLLALLGGAASGPKLVVMSATLDGARVAQHLGARLIEAEGSAFPVEIRYRESAPQLPRVEQLVERVRAALDAALGDPGDVLIFLPGKGEIEAVSRALRGGDFELIALHGGLSLEGQRQAFLPARRRKVIVATNVAETSLTLPGVGVVIDAGLVRRTRYHAGRGYLTLAAVAQDSADQRAGRAGRTRAGVCHRLWGRGAMLERVTPPELHRESLVPLVLGAAAWGHRARTLRWLDPPRDHALDAAERELETLGALDEHGALTASGATLYATPLEAPLARLVVEARRRGTLDDVIDLVSALSLGRPLFAREAHDEGALRAGDCDATALIRAVREAALDDPEVLRSSLEEARTVRARLRREQRLEPAPTQGPVDRDALVATAMAADPRWVHVVRVRGRHEALSNGGTEIELARESLARRVRDLAGVVVFETRAFGTLVDTRVVATCATPVSLATMARAGLGVDRLGQVRLVDQRVVATVERVYAGRVLATRDEAPQGPVAREALAALFLRGSLFKAALPVLRERLSLARLAVRLGHEAWVDAAVLANPSLEAWVAARLVTLGVAHGDDLALLSGDDLLAPELAPSLRDALERSHPRTVNVGDARYSVEYDLDAQWVTLRLVAGQRRDAPPLGYLPRFEGFKVRVEGPRGVTVLRG